MYSYMTVISLYEPLHHLLISCLPNNIILIKSSFFKNKDACCIKLLIFLYHLAQHYWLCIGIKLIESFSFQKICRYSAMGKTKFFHRLELFSLLFTSLFFLLFILESHVYVQRFLISPFRQLNLFVWCK